MIEKKELQEPEHVACQVCLKEIPRSAAQSAEATEYVYYFCGADCYAKWQKGDAGEDGSSPRRRDMPMTVKRYRVEGMKCGGCIAKATAALSPLPGYVAAEFDLKAGTALVQGEVDPQAVVQALKSAGYAAQPLA